MCPPGSHSLSLSANAAVAVGEQLRITPAAGLVSPLILIPQHAESQFNSQIWFLINRSARDFRIREYAPKFGLHSLFFSGAKLRNCRHACVSFIKWITDYGSNQSWGKDQEMYAH